MVYVRVCVCAIAFTLTSQKRQLAMTCNHLHHLQVLLFYAISNDSVYCIFQLNLIPMAMKIVPKNQLC